MATPRSTDVRKWAREQGLVTAARGRLPRSVLEAYAAAHPAAASPDAADGPPARAGAESAARRTPSKPANAPARRAAGAAKARPKRSSSEPTKPRAGAAGAAGPAPEDRVDERVRALETELAAVVARLDALERRMTRSLLGLKVTL